MRHMKTFAPLALAAFLCACEPPSQKPAVPAPSPSPSKVSIEATPLPAVAAGAYVEGDVAGGGKLSATALFAGAELPKQAEVAVTINVEHCGAKILTENRIVDAASKGLKNVVVTVHGVAKGKKRSAEPLVVANKGCAFVPHVSAAVAGSKITVTNGDPVLHTTHSYAGAASFFNVSIPSGSAGVTRTLRGASVVKLTCDVHNWMNGWVVVHTNPYFAVSDAQGKLEIADLPAGTYKVDAWHEDLGTVSTQVTIESGKSTEAKFEFGKAGGGSASSAAPAAKVEPVASGLPLGLDEEERKIPADNPQTPEKIALGRALFFDPRLSKDDTVSCALCHSPRKGYSNGEAVATGVGGAKGGRGSPTIINRLFSEAQFWDGRAASLEAQALGPIQNPIEMALPIDAAVKKLSAIPGYHGLFQKAFGSEEITPDRMAMAIASFERTVISGDSPFDRHESGDQSALSDAQKRGLALFRGKAKCSVCHTGFNLTDEKYHNLGVGMKAEKPDLGRNDETKQDADKGAFKTPTLREIALTAPYMHDGSQKTLEEVVEFYNKGGEPNPTLDKELKPLNLTPEEKKDLVEIMKAFSGKLVVTEAPELPR